MIQKEHDFNDTKLFFAIVRQAIEDVKIGKRANELKSERQRREVLIHAEDALNFLRRYSPDLIAKIAESSQRWRTMNSARSKNCYKSRNWRDYESN